MRRSVALLWAGPLVASLGVAAPAPRATYAPPARVRLETPAHSAISPSGAWLAFVATDSTGADQLWVRSLGTSRARRLPGTQGAAFPFWSPADRAIAFFARGKLRAISPGGTGARVICDAKDGRGGAWSPSGAIVLAPDDEGPLVRVSARGGRPTPVTHLAAALDTSDHRESVEEEEHGEPGHRMPCFLPDGRHFLYQEFPDEEGLYDVMLGSLDGGADKKVLLASSAAIYAAPGYLVFSRGQVPIAQKWDAERMEVTGPEIPVAHVFPDPGVEGAPRVSVSASRALAYSNRASICGLEWFGRDAESLGRVPMEPGPYVAVAVSSDGSKASLARYVSAKETMLWTVDLRTGIGARIPGASGERLKSKRFTEDGRELRLVPVPDRHAGHTVIRDWTTLLP